MTDASDDRPDEKASTEPPGAAPVPPTPDDKPAETQPAAAASAALPGAAPTGDQRRRRRRRRRRGPRPPGSEPAALGSAVQAPPSGDVPAVVADTAATEAVSQLPGEALLGVAPIGDQKRRRRRRRRRKGPQTADGANAAPTPAGAAPAGAAPAGENPTPPQDRAPRARQQVGQDRRPQRAGPGDRAPREFRSRDDRPRQENAGPRDRRRENKGPRGPKDRPFGNPRDAARKKPEPKLYTIQSVVDRGFEDVADETNGATRRVDWTIVKRTVADQKRAKAVSAVYILQRDGVDTEFANLAAARAAVSKTIVHPEKLTRPKADYAKTGK